MMSSFNSIDREVRYRNVFVVESRRWWPKCVPHFDAARDLVLTYDFALRREVLAAGGRAFYFDYLVSPEEMEANNHLTYEFFRRWFLDANGCDIFTSRGVSFGPAFRLDIWNDLIFTTRTRMCLEAMAALDFESLRIGTALNLVERLAESHGLSFTRIDRPVASATPEYLFPIHRWMDEKVRSRKWRHAVKPTLAVMFARLHALKDRLIPDSRPVVFVQEYYPTRKLLQRLQADRRIRVWLAQYSWAPGAAKFFTERPISITGSIERHASEARRLLDEFHARRATNFVLTNGIDFTHDMFAIIEARIAGALPELLRMLDSVLRSFERSAPQLEVMISNLGRMNSIVDAVCRSRGVPSYLIVNGMLAHAYLDEAKYADVINAYSSSIRDHYFRGMRNVVCLGDPRMDVYAHALPRTLDRRNPTITIGASGHNVTNLGSYVAVEFEFLYDVLQAVSRVRASGTPLRVVIKVRDNGYREQYESFAREYFPSLAPEIVSGTPIRQLLDRTDFYVSIYSQTLFEAACLGIPVVYYKKDTEVMYPPFDGQCELVTLSDVDQLEQAIQDFLRGSDRFDAFLRRDVMEKYIGPLDGRNFERNLVHIKSMMAGALEGMPA